MGTHMGPKVFITPDERDYLIDIISDLEDLGETIGFIGPRVKLAASIKAKCIASKNSDPKFGEPTT